jgi:monoamine oxidase
MRGLGLAEDSALPFGLSGQVEGQRVVILGAGLAGMAAAHQLNKLGYQCTLLEARDRAGGRCWTIRGGTELVETGDVRQVAAFDEGLYFNPGPARIPQHHHSTLDYCREFGVPVEVFTNKNEAAYLFNEGVESLNGQRVRMRTARADLRGYTSELLAKAVDQDALDLPLSASDQQRLIEFLSSEGDLDPDLIYAGSPRRGFRELPGAGPDSGPLDEPFRFSQLLSAGLGGFLTAENEIHQQMTMFQIAGGTDRLAAAFEASVGEQIEFGTEIQEIRKTPEGVRIVHTSDGGDTTETEADFCICTLPLSVLKDIPSDLSPDLKAAASGIGYVPTGKIGLQFKRRFWEQDDGIYGGMSWTNMQINQIWYPSSGYLGQKGVLVGYYNFGEQAVLTGIKSPEDRLALALEQGGKIHPQYSESFESAASIAWERVPYSMGGFAFYTESTRSNHYPALIQPDDRIYVAGEHASYLTGWMAGAFESAHFVVRQIHERVQAER